MKPTLLVSQKQNYHQHHQTYKWETKNRLNRQGGGVAIITKDNITNNCSRVENLEDNNQEIIWIEITAGKVKTYVGTYYGPQESSPPEEIEREMAQLRTQIIKLKQTGRVILTGDFNAKIKIEKDECKQTTSRNGKYLEELIRDTELEPVSTKAQRGNWTWTKRTNNAVH